MLFGGLRRFARAMLDEALQPPLLRAVHGDITDQKVDAIVNASNEWLTPGYGVCAAIHRAAGPGITEECASLGQVEKGDVAVTDAYDLDAKIVIHTVSPYWESSGKSRELSKNLLASCYETSLEALAERNLRSIAYPAIATGGHGFPVKIAVSIAIGSVSDWLLKHPGSVDEVRFVCYDDDVFDLFVDAVDRQRVVMRAAA